jgi:hypothetical protein
VSVVPTYYYCGLVVFLFWFLFLGGGVVGREGERERERERESEGRKKGSSRVHMGMEVLDYDFVSFATLMHLLM